MRRTSWRGCGERSIGPDGYPLNFTANTTSRSRLARPLGFSRIAATLANDRGASHRPSRRRASVRRNAAQKVSASEAPTVIPSTSRRPLLLTATATITATDTMRPFSRVVSLWSDRPRLVSRSLRSAVGRHLPHSLDRVLHHADRIDVPATACDEPYQDKAT